MPVVHSTAQEIAFLRDLGEWSVLGLSRKRLLTRYLRAAKKRHDWGALDSVVLIAYVNRQLAIIRSLPPVPTRSDPPEVFIRKANAFLAYLPRRHHALRRHPRNARPQRHSRTPDRYPHHLVDTSRGEAAIIRMDDPLPVPPACGVHLRFLMFYAAECSPLDPPPNQQLNLI